MAKNSSPNQWLWFIARRCGVHLILGAIFGAFGGAACLGLAFTIIGIVLELMSSSLSINTFSASDTLVSDNIAVAGLISGLSFGVVIGGIIGLFGFAIVGIIAPPSRHCWPDKRIRPMMLNAMLIATFSGSLLYFIWSAILGFFGYGFIGALDASVFFACIGILTLMVLGQIVGIWCGVSKLKQVGTVQTPI